MSHTLRFVLGEEALAKELLVAVLGDANQGAGDQKERDMFRKNPRRPSLSSSREQICPGGRLSILANVV